MRRICHHASLTEFVEAGVAVVGCVRPVMVGSGAAPEDAGVDASGMSTRSERQAPRPGTTVVFEVQLAFTHVPALNTLPASAQLKQLWLPDALQLAQLASQLTHAPWALSKNVFLAGHAGRQRPLALTGREDGQVLHWSNPGPEHVAQSGWHAVQAAAEAKVLAGQDERQVPLDARRLFVQVRQNPGEPAQVLQEASHAVIENS